MLSKLCLILFISGSALSNDLFYEIPQDSLITLPPEYNVMGPNGMYDYDQAMLMWLGMAQGMPDTSLYSSDFLGGYYFPVDIRAPKTKKERKASGKPYRERDEDDNFRPAQRAYVSLSDLKVERPARQTRNNPDQQTEPVRFKAERHARAYEPSSFTPIESSHNSKLLPLLLNPLERLSKKSGQLREHLKECTRFQKNFERTCGKFYDEYLDLLKQKCEAAGIEPALMLALSAKESSMRCDAVNDELGGNKSRGLFQINSNSTGKHKCSQSQMDQIKQAQHLSEIKGIDCLGNPYTNLNEAIKVVAQKKYQLEKSFDFSQISSSDQMRIIMSAYNGGEGWVIRARQDLLSYNARHPEDQHNPNRWEDLRLFYMRSWLTRDDREQHLGTRNSGRSKDNSINNLAYVESLFGPKDEFKDSSGRPANFASHYWGGSCSGNPAQVASGPRTSTEIEQ